MEAKLPEIHSGAEAVEALQDWLSEHYGPGYIINNANVEKRDDGWYATFSTPVRSAQITG